MFGNSKFRFSILILLFQAISSNLAIDDPLSKMGISCDASGFDLSISFEKSFTGVIYPLGYFSIPHCRHVVSFDNFPKTTSFKIPDDDCGTRRLEFGGYKSLVNTLVIQHDPNIETAADNVRNISCQFSSSERITSTTSSGRHTSGNAVEQLKTSSRDKLTIEMSLKFGKNPLEKEITYTDIIAVGDDLTVVVALKDSSLYKGMSIRNCKAHSEIDPTISQNVIELSDNLGCPLRKDLLSSFSLVKDKSTSDILAVASLNAFKFPDVARLYLTCSVKICIEDCLSDCSSNVTSPSESATRPRTKRSASRQEELKEKIRIIKNAMKTLTSNIESNRNSDSKPTSPKLVKRLLVIPEVNIQDPTILPAEYSEITEMMELMDSTTLSFPTMESSNETNNVTHALALDVTTDLQENGATDIATLTESGDLTTLNVPQGEIFLNVTEVIYVLSHHDFTFELLKHLHVDAIEKECVSQIRFTFVTSMLCFVIVCLSCACVVMALYIKKEKKKRLIDNYLLYSFN